MTVILTILYWYFALVLYMIVGFSVLFTFDKFLPVVRIDTPLHAVILILFWPVFVINSLTKTNKPKTKD